MRFCLLFSLFVASSSTSTAFKSFELKNGASVKGEVIVERSESYFVDLGFELIEVPKALVASIQEAGAAADQPEVFVDESALYQVAAVSDDRSIRDWYRLPAVGRAKEDAYILTGENRFWYFGREARVSPWVVEVIYETDLEDIHYSHLAVADFNQDQILELVAMDGRAHVVDILSSDKKNFSSRMFWQVFEQNMHYQGRTGANLEPRQIVINDFNGDSLPDLTLLVHDRILIYLQQ